MSCLRPIGKEVLAGRYFLRDDAGQVIETEDGLWRRVAQCIAQPEYDGGIDGDYWWERFYNRLRNLDFLPNTPTLMNAGKPNGQLAACFVLPIEDSIEGIYDTLKHSALIHKTGGGTGFDFSPLRPANAQVLGMPGVATGPCAFCLVYDKSTEVIKQGSSRRGANMMVLRVDHPDILTFIRMKQQKGVMENFNISVAITNEFMDALEADDTYWLSHPKTGRTEWLEARMVWNLIAECAWNRGEPGIIFIDRMNELSSFNEPIAGVNPCGEQPLPPYGVCNLGSINVSNFVDGNDFNWPALSECVGDAVRFLDNVITMNHNPLPEIDAKAHYYRNIGLGIMGFADALIMMGIPYDTDEAVAIGEDLQLFVNTSAHYVSWQLGLEKGCPAGAPFKSPFDYAVGMRRNATLTTLAPTGSISMIAGCSSGIEPNLAFQMRRHQMDRVFTDYHPLWRKALREGIEDFDVFVEACDVSPEYHVRMQAAFQANCDSAISKTINLPAHATVQDVQNAYKLAWELGCKGVTVYREGSRGEAVLTRFQDDESFHVYNCCDDPYIVEQEGCTRCLNCGWSKCSV